MTSSLAVMRTASQPGPIAKVDGQTSAVSFHLCLLLLFLVLEYARPPLIVSLRLQMLICLALPVLWLSSHEKPRHPIVTGQLAFLGLCSLHVPIAANNYSAYVTTRTMFSNIAVALAMSWIFSRRDRLVWGIWSWVAIMGYVAYYGVTHGGRGPGGFLGDENDLALGCVTALPFALFGFQQIRGWRKWAAAVVGLLTVMAVVTSFSRGGFVALAGVAMYCWVASRRKVRGMALLAIAVFGFATLSPPSYLEEIRSIRNTSEGTAQGRRFLWETATNMWLDHPLIGVGGGGFNWLAGRYQPRDFEGSDYNERNWSGTTVHSFYFQLLAEQGLVGTGLCGFILVSHFRTLRRLRRDVRDVRGAPPDLIRDADLYGAGLAAGMVGFAVAAAFLSVAYYPYFWYLSGIAVGLDAAVRREFVRCPSLS